LREPGAAQHAAQRIDEQRQAEAFVWRVRVAQRRQQPALQERRRVGDRPPAAVEDDAFRHRRALLGGDPSLLHRAHGGGNVQDHGRMSPGGQAECDGVGAEDRGAAAGRGDQRDEVGACEADRARLGGEPDVGRGDEELPVPHRGHRHARALAGTVDAPAHRQGRCAGPGTAVTVQQDRAVGLAQHADARARVQRAVAVEPGQHREGRDPVVGVAAELGVDQQPTQPLGVLGREVEALERDGEAAPQVIDPHHPRARTAVVGHADLLSPASRWQVATPR
jgi:hypothetical protein